MLDLDAQGVGEGLGARLGGGVGGHARPVDRGRERRGHEHVALALDDLGQAGAHGAPDAEQVDLDRALEGGRVDRPNHARRGDAGVGHDHVDPAEALDRALDGALERLPVGHVALEGGGVRAALGGHPLQLLRLEPDERDVGAGGRRAARRLGPDAAGRAGDQNRLAPQIPGHGRTLAVPPSSRTSPR